MEGLSAPFLDTRLNNRLQKQKQKALEVLLCDCTDPSAIALAGFGRLIAIGRYWARLGVRRRQGMSGSTTMCANTAAASRHG